MEYCAKKKSWRTSLPDTKYMRLRSKFQVSLNIEYVYSYNLKKH